MTEGSMGLLGWIVPLGRDATLRRRWGKDL